MGAKKKGKKKAPQIGFGFGGGPRTYILTVLSYFNILSVVNNLQKTRQL